MALVTDSDLDGILAAFGVPVRCKGLELAGVPDNDHQETQFGNMRVSGNVPMLQMKPSDVDRLALAFDDTMDVQMLGSWRGFIVKDIRPDTHGIFTVVRLIEDT